MEKINNGMVKIGVKQEDLEDSIGGLSQLKPILQEQVLIGNGSNKEQGRKDAEGLGKHFDTAIDSMIILLAEFPDYQKEVKGHERRAEK